MNIIEKIKEKLKEIFRKTKKGLAIGGTIATVGLAAGCGANKDADIIDNNVKMEQETNKENEFKNSIKVDQSELQTIENEIEELETSDDVLHYLKNMYIEEYEKLTGDTQLTTADIKIVLDDTQNYWYKRADGMSVTHGKTPAETERQISEDGYSYEVSDAKMCLYTVKLKDTDEIIDVANINDSQVATRVIPGDYYNEMKDNISTLEELGSVIPEGFDYIEQLQFKETQGETEFINNQCKAAKDDFIETIKDFQNRQKKLEQSQSSIDDEKSIDFE